MRAGWARPHYVDYLAGGTRFSKEVAKLGKVQLLKRRKRKKETFY
jgi:hypothetical protein